VFGLPILVATVVWFVPSLLNALIVKRVGGLSSRLDGVLDAGIEGSIAALFACFVFRWLAVNVTLAIPIILIAVVALWNSARKETYRLLPSAVGIIVGYYFFAR